MTSKIHAAIAHIAGGQRGNISYTQLLRAGLSADNIRHLVRIGFLHRVHRGVYSVGLPPATPADRAAAAVLACGQAAALAQFGAAAEWSMWDDWPTTFHVIAPTERRRPGIVTHRIVLPRWDIREHLGIRVTSPARTVLDCTARLTDEQLKRMVNTGRVNKATRLTDAQIVDILKRNPLHPGAKRLRWFVEDDGGHISESALEDILYPRCDKYGVPRPRTQYWIGPYRVDAVYLVEKVVLELDGWLGHGSRGPFEDDRERDADLFDRDGFVTIRITWRRFKRQPAREAARLLRILDRQRAAAA